jgi:hypothetical protein
MLCITLFFEKIFITMVMYKIFNNYWTDEVEHDRNYQPKAEVDNINWGLDNSLYLAKTEFNICFIVDLKDELQKTSAPVGSIRRNNGAVLFPKLVRQIGGEKFTRSGDNSILPSSCAFN